MTEKKNKFYSLIAKRHSLIKIKSGNNSYPARKTKKLANGTLRRNRITCTCYTLYILYQKQNKQKKAYVK